MLRQIFRTLLLTPAINGMGTAESEFLSIWSAQRDSDQANGAKHRPACNGCRASLRRDRVRRSALPMWVVISR